MKSVSSAVLGVIAVACAPSIAPSALAQVAAAPTIAPATPVATIVASPAGGNILRAGTQIPLKTSEPLTTEGKKLRVGQRVQLEVAETVTLNGQTVIPAGSPVTGEVTDVRNKGMWGKSGHITGRILYVRVNGNQIRLTGTFDDKGVTGTAGVVAAIALVPVAGFFTTGTSARIPLGAPVTAFLDEDITVAFAAPATPATVQAAPAAVPAATPAIAQPAAAAPAATKTSLVDPSLEIKATH
ncbi:hypothetical protein [Sphingobium sp.]|uniref:hypothetical protein n=1 Tax=Sphingobium sp. TaxID=1912891 RepID=UPI0026387D36|nr:hypothetical protein [Sphingobium sp.]